MSKQRKKFNAPRLYIFVIGDDAYQEAKMLSNVIAKLRAEDSLAQQIDEPVHRLIIVDDLPQLNHPSVLYRKLRQRSAQNVIIATIRKQTNDKQGFKLIYENAPEFYQNFVDNLKKYSNNGYTTIEVFDMSI